jgi:hypothetical protein
MEKSQRCMANGFKRSIWPHCAFCFVHSTEHQAGVITMYEKSPQSMIVVSKVRDCGMFTRMRAGISTGFRTCRSQTGRVRKEIETNRRYLTMVVLMEATIGARSLQRWHSCSRPAPSGGMSMVWKAPEYTLKR